MKPLFLKLAAALLAFLSHVQCGAAERVALVIGNDNYPFVPLNTACTDANAIAEMLSTKLGFDLVIHNAMAKYSRDWPQRSYQIHGSGTPAGNKIANNTWEIKPLEIYFSVTNGDKHREGITKTRVIIKLINGRLAITTVEPVKK